MSDSIIHKGSVAGYDLKLLFPVLFLVGIGIVMVYSASSALALKKFGNGYYFIQKQAIFAVLGAVALVLFRHVPYRLYRPLAYPLVLLALVFLLAIPLSGFGYSAGGSARWLRISSLTFQPSEFTRMVMVIYLAYSLDKKQYQIQDFYIGFLPHVIVLGIFTALIFMQPDFGSVMILATLTWLMMYIGGVRLLHLASSLLLLLPVAFFLMIDESYRVKRLLSFIDPWQYPSGEGYQIIHSLMAFGTGSLWGAGIGNGYQKLFYLPEPHTDFIFSVIGEELGLLGISIILALYLLILWRGILISRNTGDRFGKMLAIGLTAALMIQVCVNMGVSLGLLPTKGLTLPFLSYGGTSLLINMASVGILMNIEASG